MAQLQSVGSTPVPTDTLAARLNRISSNLEYQNERVASLLGRINSVPVAPGAQGSPAIPQFGLAELVSRMEEQAKRLADTVDKLEQIA